MKVTKQFFKEFGIQFILSILYSLSMVELPKNLEFESLKLFFDKILPFFGASFFFLSWLSGQVIRIRKTIKTEEKLTDIESLITKTVDASVNRIETLIDFVTGKDSYCYIDIVASLPYEGGQFIPFLLHSGSNPVYNINIELEDKIEKKFKKKNYEEINKGDVLQINDFVTSGHSESKPIRWHFFINSRNGKFRQEILVDFMESHWKKKIFLYKMEEGKEDKLILKHTN
ncbi:hypothetical protein EHQ24_06710 [Leptospira noumeaensis]|uniref:Uncharacterized protein n=1 Tax=Leptospira noumeaensis TaxID=2484964 RepID=A0A4R9I9V1_9LEPT|nr:hypothetical protein [Leptospira noumeaensis]TGK83289.1 hypothetical protein EHQ24_06710 [Leptospira noumeaensis]